MNSVTDASLPTEQQDVTHLRPRVAPEEITWRTFRRDHFWQRIPAWRDISPESFLDYRWQEKHSIKTPEDLSVTLPGLISKEFIADFAAGRRHSNMAVTVSPYIVSLINWLDPYNDPLRRQFLPVRSQFEPDHPLSMLDAGNELIDSPTPGLTHRYFDRVLLLVTDVCPVYCRYCTRSYAVGTDTEQVTKVNLGAGKTRLENAFQYIEARPEIEDVVISGGDVYRLRPEAILDIGHRLLNIGHLRRMRFATKGIAVQPMKLLTDAAWVDALTEVVERGRSLRKEVSLHTHFNHPDEITGITADAMGVLFNRGVIVRNLSVLLHGINDRLETQLELYRRLCNINIRPYYTYISDLVPGIEDLRTSVQQSLNLEKCVRGIFSGHNTPTFVLDAPGGGGKRDIHSFEHYDRETGISVYAAPSVKSAQLFIYADPLRELGLDARAAWRDAKLTEAMIGDALATARRKARDTGLGMF